MFSIPRFKSTNLISCTIVTHYLTTIQDELSGFQQLTLQENSNFCNHEYVDVKVATLNTFVDKV